MQCPVCTNTQLVMSERSGIEIDYCPQCRGVWLDRGELDKIIERAAPQAPAAASAAVHADPSRDAHRGGHPGHAPQTGYYRKKKREGFLGELFDFD